MKAGGQGLDFGDATDLAEPVGAYAAPWSSKQVAVRWRMTLMAVAVTAERWCSPRFRRRWS